MTGSLAGQYSIAWVRHHGKVVHVGEFASLPPRARPLVACPECGERVIMHLGRVVRFHAAHYAASACRLTAGESALHFDVKHHLADVLRKAVANGTALDISVRCAANGCDSSHVRPWIAHWDDVMVEHRVVRGGAARVPDIALLRAGVVIGAIEVRATNEVTEPKAASLAGMGIPFIEVRADRTLTDGATAWSIVAPLPVVREGDMPPWRCPRHLDVRHDTRLHAARVVDILFPNGLSLRRIFRIDVHYVDGVATSLTLTCADDPVTRMPIAGAGDARARQRAFALVAAAYEEDVHAHRHEGGAIVDSPMRWAHAGVARAIVSADGGARAARRLLLWSRYPRRYRYVKGTRVWWMPPDMSGLTWDREEESLLGEHPQWLRVRESARERYRRSK